MEYNITIRFYEELNDFLPKNQRKKDIEYSFSGRRSVKDLIEAIGVPHVEVDLILVNGEPEDFSYIVYDKDRISVYPVFETLSVSSVSRLRQSPLRDPKFVLDMHLGKLARRMRLLGFDVDYQKERHDSELASISSTTGRILLTRDIQLLKRKTITRGLFVRNTDPEKQVLEIIERLDLWEYCNPFHRCTECNGIIKKIVFNDNEELLKNKIPEGVLKWCKEFYICETCGKVYWKGSHYEKLLKTVQTILNKRPANTADK